MFRFANRVCRAHIRPATVVIRRTGLTRPTLASRAFSTSLQEPPKKRSHWFIWTVGTLATAYWGWKWYTHTNFPPVVADKLREGLMAEINGAGYRKPDYRKALKAYIEALQLADEIKMSPISDEYTGIQLKIADTYNRLGMEKEAAQMHIEIDNTYIVALLNKKVPEDMRGQTIKRDLRVAIMIALFLSTEPTQAAEMVLLPHIRLATREAVQHDPELAKFLKTPPKTLNLDFEGLRSGQLPENEFGDAFEPFKEELFTMQEMSVGMQVASANFNTALIAKHRTTELMLKSGFTVGECLLSAANLAALMYLSWALSLPYKKTAADHKIDLSQPNNTPMTIAAVQKDNELLLKLADETYAEILTTIQSLSGRDRRATFVPEAHAMALYGRGVIRTACRDWDAASDFLGEARLRAKGCEVESLMESADEEIAKLDRLRSKNNADSNPDSDNAVAAIEEPQGAQLPDVSVIYWRMAPENWIKGQPIPPIN